jgi:Polyketide cyclase / dehydrase and lipid transport
MTTTKTWRSCTSVRAAPEHVLETLTDPDACARWSPVPFSLDDPARAHLRTGTTTPIHGRLLGAPVRFDLHTVAANRRRLKLHARGPIDIHVHYTLQPTPSGCALDARISIPRPTTRFGRLLARGTALLLTTGTLEHALDRIAHEAELVAADADSRGGGWSESAGLQG